MRLAGEQLDLVILEHDGGRTPPSVHERSVLATEYAQGAFDSDPQLKRQVEMALSQA